MPSAAVTKRVCGPKGEDGPLNNNAKIPRRTTNANQQELVNVIKLQQLTDARAIS